MPNWSIRLGLLLFALFFLTSTSSSFSPDTTTNMIQAHAFGVDHSIGVQGSPELGDPDLYGRLAWFVESERGFTSKYPPGVAAWGALFYPIDSSSKVTEIDWMAGDSSGTATIRTPSTVPPRLAAAAAAALAVVFLGMTLTRLLDAEAARLATIVCACGTGVWSVAADELWQHSPNIMWISLGLWLLSSERLAGAGVAFGAAVFTRPHTALIAAGTGIVMALRRRSIRPLLTIGPGAVLGLVGLMIFNRHTYGTFSITGGYESFTDSAGETSVLDLIGKLIDSLFDRRVGMLVTTPVLAAALLGVPAAVRRVPDWALGGAIGGFAYLIVQYQANRVSGGGGFFGYRYPLEALAASFPLLSVAAVDWARRSRSRHRIVLMLAAASVGINAYGALTQ